MDVTAWQAIAMIIYFVAMVWIGFAANARTEDLDDYMLGGRRLHPAVSALSAGASDMSAWLLMGLPGAVYAAGLVEAWIAVGLTVGAWLNWKVVAPRLRAYTEVSGDSITIPSFLGSRLRDRSHVLRMVAGVVILVFFTFYVSSGMVAGGTFFETSFGMNYYVGMVLVAGITVLYTLVGGFLAVSWTDVVQGTMMVLALVALPIVGILHLGGPGEMVAAIRSVDPALLTLGSGATVVGIVSALAWGLGYVGQPHILVRFMALRAPREAAEARRIGIGWMVLACTGAIVTALVGIAVFQHDEGALANPEGVFIALGQLLFHPLIAGFMLAAILAAEQAAAAEAEAEASRRSCPPSPPSCWSPPRPSWRTSTGRSPAASSRRPAGCGWGGRVCSSCPSSPRSWPGDAPTPSSDWSPSRGRASARGSAPSSCSPCTGAG